MSMSYFLHKESKLIDCPLCLFLAKTIVSITLVSFISERLHAFNSEFINPISKEAL